MNQAQTTPLTIEEAAANFIASLTNSQLAQAIFVVILSVWLVYRLELFVQSVIKAVGKLFPKKEEEKKPEEDIDKTLDGLDVLYNAIPAVVEYNMLYRQIRAEKSLAAYFATLEARLDLLTRTLEEKIPHDGRTQSNSETIGTTVSESSGESQIASG